MPTTGYIPQHVLQPEGLRRGKQKSMQQGGGGPAGQVPPTFFLPFLPAWHMDMVTLTMDNVS